jgi:hypothetical protein
MGIYLGNVGNIELTRKSLEGSVESVVNPSDVNTERDRFSFDFDSSFLISGDLVELTTTDGTNLDFVASSGWANNTVQPSGNWYVFVDELGGIKLYETFDESLEGGLTGLVPLTAIARDIPIRVKIRDRDSRLLAAVTEYELNTNREIVDITTLSDEHRQQYSSLITGSGRLTAHWDYANEYEKEPVHYLMQLVIRTEVGSAFHGKFYIKYPKPPLQLASFQPPKSTTPCGGSLMPLSLQAPSALLLMPWSLARLILLLPDQSALRLRPCRSAPATGRRR